MMPQRRPLRSVRNSASAASALVNGYAKRRCLNAAAWRHPQDHLPTTTGNYLAGGLNDALSHVTSSPKSSVWALQALTHTCLNSWRRQSEAAPREVTSKSTALLARDPVTGREISPQIAVTLCIKPRTQLTPNQAIAVDALKTSSRDFCTMRAFAMRFRGLLRGRDGAKLDPWLDQAYHSGIYALQRFPRTLQGDLDAVHNAVTAPWSSGQTEGQISRLKTMKRAMCDRAGIGLLRARMLPLTSVQH